MYNTRKRKYNAKKKSTKRKYVKFCGGQGQEATDVEEDENSVPENNVNIVTPLFNLANTAANSFAKKAIDGLSGIVGVNLANPDAVNNVIKKELEILSNPEIQENNKNVIGEGAKIVSTGLQSAKPAIDEFVSTSVEEISKSGKKIGPALGNIVMNTLEEIPGPGILIGMVRDAKEGQKIIHEGLGSAREIMHSFTDTAKQLSETIKNAQTKVHDFGNVDLGQRISQRQAIESQTGGSIAEFHDSTLNPEKFKTMKTFTSKRKKHFITRKTFKTPTYHNK
jgi:hypothetical protein